MFFESTTIKFLNVLCIFHSMQLSKKSVVLLISCVFIAGLFIYFYLSYLIPKTTPVLNESKLPKTSEKANSQLSEVINKTETKNIKILLSSVEIMLPGHKTVVFENDRITELNLVLFSKDDISGFDFCKDYSYEVLLNGEDKLDYDSCSSKVINKHTVLLKLKMNARASKSSYLSIYPSGEPRILGIDELRIG